MNLSKEQIRKFQCIGLLDLKELLKSDYVDIMNVLMHMYFEPRVLPQEFFFSYVLPEDYEYQFGEGFLRYFEVIAAKDFFKQHLYSTGKTYQENLIEKYQRTSKEFLASFHYEKINCPLYRYFEMEFEDKKELCFFLLHFKLKSREITLQKMISTIAGFHDDRISAQYNKLESIVEEIQTLKDRIHNLFVNYYNSNNNNNYSYNHDYNQKENNINHVYHYQDNQIQKTESFWRMIEILNKELKEAIDSALNEKYGPVFFCFVFPDYQNKKFKVVTNTNIGDTYLEWMRDTHVRLDDINSMTSQRIREYLNELKNFIV